MFTGIIAWLRVTLHKTSVCNEIKTVTTEITNKILDNNKNMGCKLLCIIQCIPQKIF